MLIKSSCAVSEEEIKKFIYMFSENAAIVERIAEGRSCSALFYGLILNHNQQKLITNCDSQLLLVKK